jgi:D-threonate/D-erythronate kinase
MGSRSRLVPRGGGEHLVTIIADDLSGATDSAVACAERGLDTVVALVDTSNNGRAEAIAFDADTRRRSRRAAAAETARLVRSHANMSSGILFKKIDSTLRGHIGAEIAALLSARRGTTRSVLRQRTIVVLAPAFPAQGRTTLQGRQLLNGVPLEATELWQRETIADNASLLDMMSRSDLESELVPIETVRAGARAIRAAMVDVADRIDILICDAQTEEDLTAVAQASLDIDVDPVWAGSAGLIGHLLDAAKVSGQGRPLPQLTSFAGPLLFVVGSLSSVSRGQAEFLAAEDIIVLTIGGPTFDDVTANISDRFAAALAAGKDVLVMSTAAVSPGLDDASPLSTTLRDLIAPHAGRIGGLFATGGETARVVLTGMGITSLRPVAEIERGIPLSIAVGARPLPVITKAGAFGDATTMLNCRRVLRECNSTAILPALSPKMRIWPTIL